MASTNNNIDEGEESKGAHRQGAGHNDTVLDNVT